MKVRNARWVKSLIAESDSSRFYIAAQADTHRFILAAARDTRFAGIRAQDKDIGSAVHRATKRSRRKKFSF